MRSRSRLVLDVSMLSAALVLQAWRLTGVAAHEVIAAALIAALVLHLSLHWTWIESRAKQIRKRSRRSRVNFALNTALFVTMSSAIISGFAISKMLTPFHLEPVTWLKWHDLHGYASRTALVIAGLHLGLNWELVTAALRRGPAPAPPLQPVSRRSIPAMSVTIAVATFVVWCALVAAARALPQPDVTIVTRDGKQVNHAAPPADIAELHRGENLPSSRGIPPFAGGVAMFAISCFAGRKAFRLD